jgi:hypothetical protein
MGDLPKWKWWSHYDGWPTRWRKNVTYLAKRLGWRSLDRIRLTNCASWLQGWLEDPSWWHGWSPYFFVIFLLAGFISFLSHSRI